MRVAVTTTGDRFDTVAAALERHGLEPERLPCIAIEPVSNEELDTIRALAATADRILVTSPRTIRIVWPGSVPAVSFLSVGAATTEAIRRAGGSVSIEGDGGAADLVAGLDLSGLRIVFPHAAGADPATVSTLRENGALVDAWVAYRSVPIGPDADEVDAVMFASPSAVEGWAQTRSLDGLTVVAIGETTAATVEAHGGSVDLVPDRPGFAEMVEALHHGYATGEVT